MEEKQLNWGKYLEMGFRRKWFFVLPLCVVFVIALGTVVFLPPVYRARTILLVKEEKIINPLIRGLAVSTSVGERLRTLREEILSWPHLSALVEKLELDKRAKTPLQYERLILNLRRNISVRMKGQEIIIIAYEGRDPKETQDIVNTLAEIFIQKNMLSKTYEADTAIDFIESQLRLYETKLEESEKKLREFKELYSLQMPVTSILNTQLADLEAELTNLLVDCTEDHPRVRELRRRIKILKEKRIQEIKKMAQAYGKEGKAPQYYLEIADSLPRQEEELARLTRDYQVNEAIYSNLLQRLEAARISQRLENSEEGTKFIILEPARFPLTPVKPNWLKTSGLGLLLGLFTGIGCVVLVESFDQSLRSIDEAKEFFKIPILGSIPKIITEQDKLRFARRKKILLRWMWALVACFFLGALLAILF